MSKKKKKKNKVELKRKIVGHVFKAIVLGFALRNEGKLEDLDSTGLKYWVKGKKLDAWNSITDDIIKEFEVR